MWFTAHPTETRWVVDDWLPIHQVDLIIAKSGLASCGYLRAPQLLPCVGNNAYTDQDGICTELQLYHCLDSDLAVLQQRAPAALGRLAPFIGPTCCGAVQHWVGGMYHWLPRM